MRTSEQLLTIARDFSRLFKSHRPDFTAIDAFVEENGLKSECLDDQSQNFVQVLCLISEDQRSDPAVKALRYYLAENSFVDVNYATKKGITAIMIACERENVELIKVLSEYKSDIFRTDTNGVSALMRAFKNPKYVILQTLADHVEFADTDVRLITDDSFCAIAGEKYEEASKRKDKDVCRLIRGSVGSEYLRRRYPNNAYDAAKNKQAVSRYTGATQGVSNIVSSMWNYFF